MALSFALAVVALVSLLVLHSVPPNVLRVHFTPERVRAFKGERSETTVQLESARNLWGIPRLVAVIPPKGVDAAFEPMNPGQYRLSFVTKFAGRFTGITTRVEMHDMFALFTRAEEDTKADFILDSLPTGLLTPLPIVSLSVVALGDAPSGTKGLGQEFFAAELYDLSSDTRDLLWRRIAAMADEKLVVKAREANIPDNLQIGFLETEERGDALPRWMDLVSEAVARVGGSLLKAGVKVRLVSERQARVSSFEVREPRQLADAIMEMWSAGSHGHAMRGDIRESDIMVTGTKDLASPEVLSLVSLRPSVVVSEERSAGAVGPRTVVYTGKEDVGKVVQTVLTR